MTSLLFRGLNSGNQCNNYMISRAFIPPWSLVVTKPETLGPDTSRKEAGTLVSRYNFTENQFYISHSEIQQEIIKIFFRFALPDLDSRYFISMLFGNPALSGNQGLAGLAALTLGMNYK